VVEEREDYVNTSRAEAKKKIAEVELLEAELKDQLKEARLAAQKVILEAEQDSDNLYKEALALANAEANSSREKARLEIDSQRDDALNQLKSESDSLGNLIIERLLAKK
jgi:F-type H+-transporting ATPase subunit b